MGSLFILKVWSWDQHHQHYLVACKKGKFMALPYFSVAVILGVRPRNLGLYQLFWLFWCSLKFENHWPQGLWNKLSTSNWWFVIMPGCLSPCKGKKCGRHAIFFWLEVSAADFFFPLCTTFPSIGIKTMGYHTLKLTWDDSFVFKLGT